ncbi:MAG: hypothetical protein L0H84_23495 [Pseudonocardia sp.]|nr:hypothetical protein [Pseudonocardia sp.]
MPERHAHLVGSMPGADAEEAMSLALEVLGPHLRTLPDGETGERFHWILHIESALRSHPDLEVAKEGDWSDYDKVTVLKVRRGHRLLGANLDFGHARYAAESWPVFERLRAAAGRPELPFQVGIPGDLDMAMFTLGPTGALRHRRAFTESTVATIRRIHEQLGDQVVFQLEVPVELVLLARAPAVAQPALAALLARGMVAVAAAAPAGARFGVHLCVGDMNHKAFGSMSDVSPLVRLAAAIVGRWPDGRPLEFVHAPFAGADVPPSTDPAFYGPLDGLRLPSGTRFVAGFAHEKQGIAEQRAIRDRIEGHLRRRVDVAAACGLGRRQRADAEANLRRVAELV